MVYVNGNVPRLVKLYGDVLSAIPWKTFRAWNLLDLKAQDIFMTVRAWDAVAKFYASFLPARRPAIVQLADGHISELNCRKKENQRQGGHLYGPLLCDVFVAFNNRAVNCFADSDAARVRYVRPLCARHATPSWKGGSNTWVIASGNDPFFDTTSKQLVVSALRVVEREARRLSKQLLYSVTDELLKALGTAQRGRRFDILLKMDPLPELVFTTPSTIALEAAARGIPVCVVNCWSQDINFPRDLAWNPDQEELTNAIFRISNIFAKPSSINLFGLEYLEDVLKSVLAAPDSHKVDLRASAKQVKLTLANTLGSVL
jgi:hypothetical protein